MNSLRPDGRDPNAPDLLQHAVILVLLIAGGIAFGLAAVDTGVVGLPEAVAGVTCWGLAAHLVKVGRIY